MRILEWNNDNNQEGYENMPLSHFKDHVAFSGLKNNEDIEAIYTRYLKESTNLLELGAGCGRVVKALLKKGFCGNITALERNPRFVNSLNSIKSPNLLVEQQNILNAQLRDKYDAVLLLWIGLAEFSRIEQNELFKKYGMLLKKGGYFIVDMVESEYSNYSYEFEYGTFYRSFLEQSDIERLCKKYSLCLLEKIQYSQTLSGRQKYLYIIQK